MSAILVLVVALIAIFLAWKVLKGVIKMAVLVGIVVLAAVFVLGGFH